MYWIGVDGGGTKTEFILSDDKGEILCHKTIGSISHKQVGAARGIRILSDTIKAMIEEAYIENSKEIGVCCALPCWGESREDDRIQEHYVQEFKGDYLIRLVNDCEVGWAGSLGMEPGINLVAGTGSIVYGKDVLGRTARAGGWSEVFSDEGSCLWFGRKAIGLFAKESDGREAPGALLEIIREHFKLKEDYDVISIFERYYQNDRTNLASLQKLLLQAAARGDEAAIRLYGEGAAELAQSVLAVYHKLEFTDPCVVSYSGGLFHAGKYILEPLKNVFEDYEIVLKAPLFSPACGAVLLAAAWWGGDKSVQNLKSQWINDYEKEKEDALK